MPNANAVSSRGENGFRKRTTGIIYLAASEFGTFGPRRFGRRLSRFELAPPDFASD
jgi:hypothetical protein